MSRENSNFLSRHFWRESSNIYIDEFLSDLRAKIQENMKHQILKKLKFSRENSNSHLRSTEYCTSLLFPSLSFAISLAIGIIICIFIIVSATQNGIVVCIVSIRVTTAVSRTSGLATSA